MPGEFSTRPSPLSDRAGDAAAQALVPQCRAGSNQGEAEEREQHQTGARARQLRTALLAIPASPSSTSSGAGSLSPLAAPASSSGSAGSGASGAACSNSSAYEEAESVDENGDAVYVERDLEYGGIDPGALDIWRLDLHSGQWERVTTFNRWAPYYASNPVVSPDGEMLAFQLSFDGETEGQGEGILLLDLGGD